MTVICELCGQPIRPGLHLTAAEMKLLDSLAERDWYEWAMKVFELSDPKVQNARAILLQLLDGGIDAGEAAKMLDDARAAREAKKKEGKS